MVVQIEKMFTAIEKSTESIEFKLKISIFELYMEKIRDLLDISKTDLKIRENKQGPYVENLTEVYVGEKSQLFKLIQLGQKNRVTCATNMNEHSSRSHMIFLLSLNQFNSSDSSSKTSKLFLIDLAGSEKVAKTGASGKVLQEAKKINLSLTNLGKVIKTLAEKNGHIPYRDSKLTRILRDSLGGNSKTTLIVTCSPHASHLPETLSTLRFGQNAQKIKNKPKINRELTVQELQKIVEKLEKQLEIKTLTIQLLQEYIQQTLHSELPDVKMLLAQKLKTNKQQLEQHQKSQSKSEKIRQWGSSITTIEKVEDFDDSVQIEDLENVLEHSMAASEEYETRIGALESELTTYKENIEAQQEKYVKLKKQYTELHENLNSILKQNIQLQEQKVGPQAQIQRLNQELEKAKQNIEELKKENAVLSIDQSLRAKKDSSNDMRSSESIKVANNYSAFQKIEDNLIKDSVSLIKMIVGELFEIIGPYQQQEIIKIVQNDSWYQKIMEDGEPCIDFYQCQRQRLKQEVQQFFKEKEVFEKEKSLDSRLMSEETYQQQMRQQARKQNQKIIVLENKLDKLFDEYHQMITLQTSWKAECQLYERKLKRKEEKIQELEEMLEGLEEQVQFLEMNQYQDIDDSHSVKSKIVKPIKGGMFFR